MTGLFLFTLQHMDVNNSVVLFLSKYQLGVHQFNSILTLTTWGYHQTPQM